MTTRTAIEMPLEPYLTGSKQVKKLPVLFIVFIIIIIYIYYYYFRKGDELINVMTITATHHVILVDLHYIGEQF